MITVSIEPADNGVIKYVIDDNINGGGEEHVSRMVYDLDDDPERVSLVNFIQDLILDLGLETGTEIDQHMLHVKTEWGKKYNPSVKETKERIKQLEAEIERLSAQLQ
jgi:uncharacterized small protein (DUF1192 family)